MLTFFDWKLKNYLINYVFFSVTKAGLIGFVKSNIGMLLEVADSLFILLRKNISLLLSAIGTLVSVLLGGGHAVLKFLFNTVRIFTFANKFIFNRKIYYFLDNFLHHSLLPSAIKSRSLCSHSHQYKFIFR